MFAIFNVLTIFGQLVPAADAALCHAALPVRGPRAAVRCVQLEDFRLLQIVTEIPWNSLMSVFMFACVYYPVGLYQNGDSSMSAERGALMWLLFGSSSSSRAPLPTWSIAVTDTAEAGRASSPTSSSCSPSSSAASSPRPTPCRLLDLDVPRLPLHLPRLRHPVHRPRKHGRHVLG